MKPGPKPRPFESFLRPASGGCIEWAGATLRSNYSERHRYGRFTRDGRKRLAHRVAYENAHGPIPTGMCVMHRCDNPLCCNPEHLELGTQRQNYHDAIRKGRANPVQNGLASGRARRKQRR